jgi:hypothetical protein
MEIVDGVFNANIYIDGEFVVTSHNFYNYSGSATAAPGAIGKYVRFSSTGGVDAIMLLDNVTSTYVSEIKAPPVFEGTNDFEYYDVGKSYVLGTSFELASGTLSVQNDPVRAANKAFNFYANGSGNAVFFDIYGEKTNAVVVELDLMLADVLAESHLQLSIGGSYTLQITPVKSGKFQIIDRNDVTTWGGEGKEYYKSKNFTGGYTVSCGEWHKIRIEYSVDETTCLSKIYLDGNLLGESDNFYNYKGERTAPAAIGDNVAFRATGGCNANVWFDNVTTKYVEIAQ